MSEPSSGSRTVSLRITTESITRSAKETFQIGDTIGIYAVTRNTADEVAVPGRSDNRAHNAKWVLKEEGWEPATLFDIILWDEHMPMDFYAYYPYSSLASKPDSIPLAVETQQTAESAFLRSDVLLAKNTTGLMDGIVDLHFRHAFSLVNVYAQPMGISLNYSTMKTKLTGVNTGVVYNMQTGDLTPTTTGSIVLRPMSTQGQLQALVPAQEVPDGQSTIQIDDAEETYISHLDAYTLESGKMENMMIYVMK